MTLRVACHSPLPPSASGIADYTAELAPHLAQFVDLTLVVGDSDFEPSLGEDAAPVLRAAAARRRASEFDLHLYQLGNNPDYHAHVWKEAQRVPGVVVLHEFMLHHLVRGLTLDRGDRRGYVMEMGYAYGERAARMAEESVASGLPFEIWSYPLFERVADASLGVIVHSEFARRRVLQSRHTARVRVIPQHLALPEVQLGAAPRQESRRRLGYDADDLVVGCYGFVTPQKRLDLLVRAFRRVRERLPEARLLIAGAISPDYDLERPLGEERSAVQVTGRLELSELLRAMLACDVAVNLRWPTAGETSGTLMRLLGLGRPVIVSDHGAFAEIPPGCAARVAPGEWEEEHLTALLERLLTDRDLAASMGRNARRVMLKRHSLEDSARAYAEFLNEIAAADLQVFAPAPPLLPFERGDMSGRVLAGIGRAAAELGVHEGDRELLKGLAEEAMRLGITPRTPFSA